MGVLDLLPIVAAPGWLVVVVLMTYQLFWPLWETRLQRMVFTVATEVRTDIAELEQTVESIEEKQLAHIQVTRASVSTNDEIDDGVVDDYLVENGIDKDEFFADSDPPRPADD